MDGGRIAAAVIGGYLLGRTKKMKLAIMVGGALMGKKIPTDPTQLLKLAGTMVEKSPELQRLDTAVRGRLMEAGKDAALAVASSRMEALTDNLVNRVETLGKPAGDAAQAAGTTVGQAGGAVGDAAGTAGTAVNGVATGVGGAASGVAGRRRGQRKAQDEPPVEPEDDASEDDLDTLEDEGDLQDTEDDTEVEDADDTDDAEVEDEDEDDTEEDAPSSNGHAPAQRTSGSRSSSNSRNGSGQRTGTGSPNSSASRSGSGRSTRRKAVAND